MYLEFTLHWSPVSLPWVGDALALWVVLDCTALPWPSTAWHLWGCLLCAEWQQGRGRISFGRLLEYYLIWCLEVVHLCWLIFCSLWWFSWRVMTSRPRESPNWTIPLTALFVYMCGFGGWWCVMWIWKSYGYLPLLHSLWNACCSLCVWQNSWAQAVRSPVHAMQRAHLIT